MIQLIFIPMQWGSPYLQAWQLRIWARVNWRQPWQGSAECSQKLPLRCTKAHNLLQMQMEHIQMHCRSVSQTMQNAAGYKLRCMPTKQFMVSAQPGTCFQMFPLYPWVYKCWPGPTKQVAGLGATQKWRPRANSAVRSARGPQVGYAIF